VLVTNSLSVKTLSPNKRALPFTTPQAAKRPHFPQPETLCERLAGTEKHIQERRHGTTEGPLPGVSHSQRPAFSVLLSGTKRSGAPELEALAKKRRYDPVWLTCLGSVVEFTCTIL